MAKRYGKKRAHRPRTMAERAERYELYEKAVHDPRAEVDFIRSTFMQLRARDPLTFREDFSGPASAACEWVSRGPRCQAVAVDIEPGVLEWGLLNRVNRLGPRARQRVRLINANVLNVTTRPMDVIAALNFSYWVFRERKDLLRYFRSVLRGLKKDGILFLDAFGGYESVREVRESTRHGSFTYVWDQARYRPVTGEFTCHIHFRFVDGSRMNRAFTYEWRLWSLPEIRDLLREAGFRRSTVYWEGDDGKGGGNGVFLPNGQGDADATWVAYVVAER